MKSLPGLQDVSSDQQNGGLDLLLDYDRRTAAKLGLTVQTLDSNLYDAFGQAEVSIQALGGGWTTSQLPTPAQLSAE